MADCIFLGWLGSRAATDLYTLLSLLGTLYYFGFFLVIMPVLGLIEKPKRLPNSITEAVLEKDLPRLDQRLKGIQTMKKFVTSIRADRGHRLHRDERCPRRGRDTISPPPSSTRRKDGHYPLLKPKNVDWSFAGPFGKYDKAQLQRGLKVFFGSLRRLPFDGPGCVPDS